MKAFERLVSLPSESSTTLLVSSRYERDFLCGTVESLDFPKCLANLLFAHPSPTQKPGMSGEEIDEFVYQQCLQLKCYPSPLNYLGFPKSVTLSTNNVAIHGIPDERKLMPGDILTVDVSIFYQGHHADTACTLLIGKESAIDHRDLNSNLVDSGLIDLNGLNLIRTAQRCLTKGIEACKAGAHLNEIGRAIEAVANEGGFKVVPAVCGHSIGEYLHGEPQIVHCPYDEYTEGEWNLIPSDLTRESNELVKFEP